MTVGNAFARWILSGWRRCGEKKDAKKLAAFAVRIMIMRSAGIDDEAWDQQLGDALEAAQE